MVKTFLGLFLALYLGFGVGGAAIAQTATQTKPPSIAPAAAKPDNLKPYFDRVAQAVQSFRLSNGMKFIVLERHDAPVVSFMLYADVGGVDEPDGQTGVAHFLEHLAFKGTERIGTTDYAKEAPLLAAQDKLAEQIGRDPAKAQQVLAEIEKSEQQSLPFVKQNEFGQIVQQAGGVGLNANTSVEATRYFYSLPSNKLELWMSLESDRFFNPVFREFYKEKSVILEERRMRTENSPVGQMIEAFLAKAFVQHPYGRAVIGSVADLQAVTRPQVRSFFDKYYGPGQITAVIVGDVDPAQVKAMANSYFGRLKSKPAPPQVKVVEPAQTATREVNLKLPSQPIYLEAYHRPGMNHPDAPVYDAIAGILSNGRNARLYKSLVEQKKLALGADVSNGFPGDKYPTLILLDATTAPGVPIDQVEKALHEELDRLVREPVGQAELDRYKAQSKVAFLGLLDSNSGMASTLAEYEVKTGDWRNAFKEAEQIDAITPADIQRVAKATFRAENRTIGRILPQSP
jgi:predicted Zn-dependent peptidase